MVPSILQGGLPRCLFLWWDFCCRVSFRKVLSSFWGTLFLFFPSSLFDCVSFQYSQALVIFLLSKLSDSFLIWQFYRFCNRAMGLMSRVFANGTGDRGSIPDRVIPKTPKMVLDAAFLNTRHYKVRIKGKVEQSRGRRSAFSYTLV